ncbi:chloride channel CLIC-like protein 1 isoform 2-T2 [Clarias gariepinus]
MVTNSTEHGQDSFQMAQCLEVKECTDKVNMLQREIEKLRRRGMFSSQQPTCISLFKRFLTKLLKEMEELDLPTAETESSQKLINFTLHDFETWKGHSEDTIDVELDTVIKVILLVFVIVVIICIKMWSVVPWFVQLKRMYVVCFFITVVWNWLYLYKIAFYEQQARMLKFEDVMDKCTGMTEIDWLDSFEEWYQTMSTQDDPCQKYYEVLIMDTILQVPPTKAITMTITTFFTDPLKHIGEGINEFLRALLKDMPITLQISVLFCVVLSILVCIYSTSQAADTMPFYEEDVKILHPASRRSLPLLSYRSQRTTENNSTCWQGVMQTAPHNPDTM